MARIVLQQGGERLGVGNVVHRDELQLSVSERCPKDIPANAAESVNRNLDRHASLLLLEVTNRRLLFRWTHKQPERIPLEGKSALFYKAFDLQCQPLKVNST